MRSTRQRSDIRALIDSLEGFHSAQEIHLLLEQSGKPVGLATVYRTLTAMAEKNEIDALTIEGELLYRRCSTEHHHHLRCRNCGATIEISAVEIESWAKETALKHGFADVSHSIEINGLCPQCR